MTPPLTPKSADASPSVDTSGGGLYSLLTPPDTWGAWLASREARIAKARIHGKLGAAWVAQEMEKK